MKFISHVFILIALVMPIVTFASAADGAIDSVNKYAWSNQTGWVNFGAANGNVHLTDLGITGYVWNSNYGWVNMSPTKGGVKIAADGTLSGYAWGSELGWINFSGVAINSSGKFTGKATGQIIGTLNFDCSNCNVVTDYRPSSFRTVTAASSAAILSSGGGGIIFGLLPVSVLGTIAQPAVPSASNLPESPSTILQKLPVILENLPARSPIKLAENNISAPTLFDIGIMPALGVKKLSLWWWILVAIVIISLYTIATIVLRRRRKFRIAKLRQRILTS